MAPKLLHSGRSETNGERTFWDERLQDSSNPLCSTLRAGAASFLRNGRHSPRQGNRTQRLRQPRRKRSARHSGVTKIYGAKSNSSSRRTRSFRASRLASAMVWLSSKDRSHLKETSGVP